MTNEVRSVLFHVRERLIQVLETLERDRAEAESRPMTVGQAIRYLKEAINLELVRIHAAGGRSTGDPARIPGRAAVGLESRGDTRKNEYRRGRAARFGGLTSSQECQHAPSRGDLAMASIEPGGGGREGSRTETRSGHSFPGRHAIRDQDVLWAEFLAMSERVVNSLDKGIQVLCEGRLDLVAEVKDEEEESDRREVHIEQECLRVLALYEPVASDLRRLATILKVNRDWERIADLAARIARRARKLARKPYPAPIPEAMSTLAGDVLLQVRASYESLRDRDAQKARAVIAGDRPIDQQYRRLRNELKEQLRAQPDRLTSWLQLMSTARNLERIADHATGIAQMVVYLQEGSIIRHVREVPPPEE